MFDWLLHFNGDCTLWLDRLLWWDWSTCCAAHDLDYALHVVKELADEKLRVCVNAVLKPMGDVMWAGVALFGGFWYGNAIRKKVNGK